MRYLSTIDFLFAFIFLGCSSHSGSRTYKENDHKKETEKSGYVNPVFEPVLADPSVVYSEATGCFYAYGTEDDWADGEGRKLVPILESDDLLNWKYVGDAFESKPDWKADGGIWAPDINKIGENYFLYYAYSTWGDENPGVGLAIADNPKGPFTDQGKLFDSKSMGVPNSIDPFYYAEGDEKYLFWGSYSDLPTQGTYAVALSKDGKKVENDAEKVKIAAGDFEAVMIHKHENYYYFFGSKGSCCEGENSTYHLSVARAKDLLGPYLDKKGNDISKRGNGSLLLAKGNGFVGPGHVSGVITDKTGKDWVLYHAIDSKKGKLSNGTSRRILMLEELKWKEGWPLIKDKKPSNSSKNIPKL